MEIVLKSTVKERKVINSRKGNTKNGKQIIQLFETVNE